MTEALTDLIHLPPKKCSLNATQFTNRSLHPAASYSGVQSATLRRIENWIVAQCLIHGIEDCLILSIDSAYRNRGQLVDSTIRCEAIFSENLYKRHHLIDEFTDTLTKNYQTFLQTKAHLFPEDRFSCNGLRKAEVLTTFTFDPHTLTAHDRIEALSLVDTP